MLGPSDQSVVRELKKLAFTIAFAVTLGAAIVFKIKFFPVLVLLAVLLTFFSPLPLVKSIWSEHRGDGQRQRNLAEARRNGSFKPGRLQTRVEFWMLVFGGCLVVGWSSYLFLVLL